MSPVRHDGLLRAFAVLRALLDRPHTLAELAQAHRVTTRTIRRDFDVLSLAGFEVFNHEFEEGHAGKWALIQRACPVCQRRRAA